MPRRRVIAALALLGAAAAWQARPAWAAEAATTIPAPADDPAAPASLSSDTAVLAGGCFWGVQAVFQHVKGVSSAVSGYAGGDAKSATYDAVSEGSTGHAEAVRITFDPRQISYGQLLQIYFSVAHDPTELNRQGPDVGSQYRSTIFPANAEQMRVAKNYVAQLDKARVFRSRIATTIEPTRAFYPAEKYHQDFLVRNPNHPYIVINDLPKIDQLKRRFPERFKTTPALVGT
ncbi:MAG: peptide-methionine (S)-S-oxide reductase [Variovorax sp.]|nr:MAG: peptide-methionine (S)-S-oxide reductase [Variovorax sp.]